MAMLVQAKFLEKDKKKRGDFIESLNIWSYNNGKHIRQKKLSWCVIVDLPKYSLDEFRIVDVLAGLPLSLICEEYIRTNNDEAVIVCGSLGERLDPFFVANGSEYNAKFSCSPNDHLITLKAKKTARGVNIIAHDVYLLIDQNSVYIKRDQLFNYPSDHLSIYSETKHFRVPAMVVLDKLLKNKKNACFIKEKV
jgi:hypothetical protein